MNRPVLRLYGLVVVLFGVLVVFTSRWTVFEAEALRDNELNRRELLQEQKIRRGTIRSADGEVLARSVPQQGDTFGRRYPTGELFAHAVGYSYTTIGRAGPRALAQRRADRPADRAGVGARVDPRAARTRATTSARRSTRARSRSRSSALRGVRPQGALVALDVKTGGVLVMASEPELRPERARRRARRSRA